MFKARWAALIAVSAVTALAACSAEPGQQPVDDNHAGYESFEELVEAAQAEGSVKIYTSLLEPDMNRLVESFESEYGIQVEALRLGGGDALVRFDSESEARAPSADVLIVAEAAYFSSAIDNGYIVPLDDLGVRDFVPEYPEELLVPEMGTAVVQIASSGWVYNTDLVTPEEIPSTWEGLLDPKWTGQLLNTPGDANLNALLTLQLLSDEYGIEFLSEISDQVGRTYPNLVPMHEAVAAGEGLLGLTSVEFFVDSLASGGAPLGFVSIAPTYFPIHTFGVASAAENPAAARLLATYLLSEDGVRTIATGTGVYSPYDTELIPPSFMVPSTADIERAESNREELVSAYR